MKSEDIFIFVQIGDFCLLNRSLIPTVKIPDSVLDSALALQGKEGDMVREKLKAQHYKRPGKN